MVALVLGEARLFSSICSSQPSYRSPHHRHGPFLAQSFCSRRISRMFAIQKSDMDPVVSIEWLCHCLPDVCTPNVREAKESDSVVGVQHSAAEEGEARAVLMRCLKGLGLSATLSSRMIRSGDRFVGHLLSIIHTRYRLRYVMGRKPTNGEIRETLVSYLEALAAEHGDDIVNFVVHFPELPPPPPQLNFSGSRLPPQSFGKSSPPRGGGGTGASAGLMLNGNFKPAVSYVLSLGLSLEDVEAIAKKSPSLISCKPEKKIEPVVNYFLGLGVTKPGILKIFLKRPQIFVCSLEDHLKPSMLYLESLGVERSQWSKILVQLPALLTHGKKKIQEVVVFLYEEVGLSSADVGFIVSRFPHVVSFSVDKNLVPTLEFLRSAGIKDMPSFLRSSPQVLGFSVDGNIKPTIRFFVELGYSQAEVITIINKFPQVLGLAIDGNIKPKWDYYAEIGWPKSYLVAFPQYFGYSLESRIKPRFEEVLRQGVCWSPNQILCSSDAEFRRLLRNQVKELSVS